MKKFTKIAAMLFLIASITGYCFAQGSAESSVRGNLAGSVVDSSGAVVTGAKVTISGATGTKSDTTNQEGQFLFPLLTPGFYSLKVEKGSFKTADVKGVEVVTGKTSNVRVGMVAGQQTEVVEVSGSAITVDTTSTAVASNLTDSFYSSVPVARGVTGLFYAAPGVTSGGGTGTANPSISGGTGLENSYVADGVNITDGGFGGIGVYSRVFGSLSTGINLSFVKEVQVKTGGFEAQYGHSTGGIVQIVTKSGTNDLHGSVGGYFAPQQFEAERKQVDDFAAGTANQHFNLAGKILHQSNYDLDAEVGGHVPGFKDKLFFFGSFNPQWNTDHDQLAQFRNPSDLGTAGLTGPTQTSFGNLDITNRVYSYAGKLTWKVSDKHQFESSIFGDPTYGSNTQNGASFGGLAVANTSTYDKLTFGTRNFVVRYNGALTPSWLVNGSFSWGHNTLTDAPGAPDVFSITDFTQTSPCGSPNFNPACTATTNDLRGQYFRQGLGYFENTQGDNYGFKVDTSKAFHFLGSHDVSVGYGFERSHYNGTKDRSGPHFVLPTADALGNPTNYGILPADAAAAIAANPSNATFQLKLRAADSCIGGGQPAYEAEIYIPGMANCPDGGVGVTLNERRGEFGNLSFKNTSNYHSLYAADTWSLNKFVTVTAGLRWEQQQLIGTTSQYTFTDNWSPRVGIAIDPWGNRKTKVYANFSRLDEALPLDVAIRSLTAEFDSPAINWVPTTDGAGHVVINPDGSITPTTDAAHLRAVVGGASLSGLTAFAPGTRTQYLDEYVVGFEHEFGNSGVIFSARYQDRRLKRIVEDTAAVSPEAFQCCLNQQYLITNPNKSQDIFVNPNQFVFNDGGSGTFLPGSPCDPAVNPDASAVGFPTDSNGNPVVNSNGTNAFCVTNSSVAGNLGGDGIADGFVDPVRIYKSMEFEVNKSFSKNWQLRANYRIAKLFGNYEGTYRNDNAQSDPNISSLFDFTRGDFNLLGGQFLPGALNQDVRHTANGFVSYTFGNHYMKGLTLGTSVRFQTGTPISNLFAHPAYFNAGEVPVCADGDTSLKSCGNNPRGSLGRTLNNGSVDLHADYPIRLTERTKIRLAADLFNLTDMRTQLRVDQFAQTTVGVPNADFGKPRGIGPSATSGNTNPGYQRPFYARFGVKFEF
jgi:hypothetical protein